MDETRIRDLAKDQLNLTYSQYRFDRENAFKTRNWCISVSLAALALVATGKVTLGFWARLGVVELPILMFWISEAVQMALARLCMEHSQRLVKVVLGLDSPTPQQMLDEYTLESTFMNTPRRAKISKFKDTALKTETVAGFYAFIAVVMFVIVAII